MLDQQKKTNTLYWIFTLLFILPMIGSGLAELLGAASLVESMNHLGYPLYFMKILGTAKLLGALAILTGRSRPVKEWAYAGFTFDMLGATISHLAMGDTMEPIAPALFLVLMIISYINWKKLSLDRK